MSPHAKIALGLFLTAFALTRVQRFVVSRLESDTAMQLTAMVLLSGAALIGLGLVFACFYFRWRTRRLTPGRPVHGWQWALLLLLSAAYATEPAGTFVGLAMALSGA